MNAKELIADLDRLSDQIRATHSLRFFKTGIGEYGEGDQFIGVTMPDLRSVCRNYRRISLQDLRELLYSPIHEHRMAAVVIMSDIFKKKSADEQKKLYDLYLKAVKDDRINNWDLVDVSAKNVVGVYLLDKPRDILYDLARSDHLWSKRVAMLSTPAFYAKGDVIDTLTLAEVLLHDTHDLIQKAVGWMLREVGKYADEAILLDFLNKHAHEMPRTMLRYAIERLSPSQKAYYMTYQF